MTPRFIALDWGISSFRAYLAGPGGEVADEIASAGGILSVAHPGRHFTDPHMFLPLLETGIDGIEVFHPSHWHVTREYYRVLCEQHGRLITGGSDFHGSREYDESNFGVFGVTRSALEKITEAMQSRHHADRGTS